ncbi:hypothetical protein SAMN05216353_110113 [Halobacillus alkaliphilus]|uniref:Uncharacterized protein n=1 Tax=Halobacillus alkaliphilus TaxID=396056 RepID=A0A1I2M359_9BACI|nr:hypothetical protein [Halobacillus alkaliphilus]SFF83977.1 hypothetical protein SAMN05216353_110113 [Halobacillus alkaliphilus]
MWATISVIAVSLLIFFLEFPRLKRKKKTKEMWCFSTLLFIATTVSVLESRNVNLPNPLDYIQAFYNTINSWIGL